MKSMIHRSFNPAKCKTSLKLAESRIKLLRNKKGIQLTQLKREVAQLLSSGQHQTAMIRVEHVIREEKMIAAYDLIEIYSALILARLPIIESQKMCPTDLKEAVTSIIFAAPRCADIPELKDISKHFTAKYGKEFANAAIELLPDSGVGRTLVEKLSARAPDGPAKVKILTAIAGENSIKWEPSWFEEKEPEPPLLKVSNTDKGNRVSMGNAPNLQGASSFEPREDVTSSRIHGFASNHQTAPSFEPMYGVSSTVHDASRSERNSSNLASLHARYGDKPTTAYSDSYARPPDTEFESVRSYSSSTCVGDAHFVGKPINNKVFKDAADAANAAARSAEEASRAAKAASELASRGKNMSRTDSGSDFDYAHNRADHGHKDAAFREDPMERKLIHSPPHERKSRMEEDMREDVSRKDKAYAAVSEEPFKGDLTALHIRHDSFKQRSPRIQAERKEKGRMNEGSPNKDNYQTVEEHKDEFPCGTDNQWAHHSPRSDTRFKSRSQNGLADYIETSSYSNHQEDFVENPFFEAVGQTQNNGSGSQYVDLGEDYGVHPNLNVPKFDDGPNEDSFTVFSERYALKEDWEVQEPLHHVAAAQFSDLYSQKDDIFSYSEQERYGIKPGRVPSLGMEHGKQYTEKGHELTDTLAGAVFDDYGSDDDADTVIVESKEDMESSTFYNPSASDSPLKSSPGRSRSTISQERQSSSSSKNLFQPELSEISKSSLWSQPDKPLPIKFDDLDDGEESNTRAFSEEHHQLGSTSTIKKSSRQKTSISDSKSFENYSFSGRQDDEEENQRTRTKLTSPEELPGLTDYHRSNAQSRSELNLEFQPRGRRNIDYSRRPPYTIDPSTLSSSRPSYTSDPSTLSSSIHSLGAISKVNPPLEHLESPNQSESTGRKHSSLSHYSAGYDPKADDDRYIGTGDAEPTGASLDFEQPGSLDKGPRETVPTKGVSVGPGFSRRTRAPRNSVAYSKPEFISPYEELLDTVESVPKKESPSAHSYTASERAELLRWAENKAADKPTHQQNFEGEENAKPSVEEKRMPNSADGSRSGSGSARSRRKSSERPRTEAEAYNQPIREPKMSVREENLRPSVEEKKPTDSKGGSTPPEPRSVEKAAFKDNSMKKPGHVHPNLPTDFDDFAERLKALHLDR